MSFLYKRKIVKSRLLRLCNTSNIIKSVEYPFIAITVVFMTTNISCKKFITVDPPATSTTGVSVYSDDVTAIAALTGIYTELATNFYSPITGKDNVSVIFTGLSGDELTLWNEITSPDNRYFYYRNELSPYEAGSPGSESWNTYYSYIFLANSAIEGLTSSSTLTASVKRQLLGEAKFIRAFIYFHLVNLFGEIPYTTTTDWKTNSSLSRTPVMEVYQNIITDLREAQELLSADYLTGNLQKYTGSFERLRPAKWVATALLSRVYLYNEDWLNAEAQATSIINNTGYYKLTDLNDVFLKNSSEAIWQLQPTSAEWNTEDGRLFIIPEDGPSYDYPLYISDFLINSFDSGDLRRDNWINSVQVSSADIYFYPYKYKSATSFDPVTEYLMVLRLPEQYLIRAEARIHLNNIEGAKSDINIIRKRAGLNETLVNDKEELLTAVLHERQVEYFTEMGHRWFDLKRTGKIDAVMTIVTPLKANGAKWNTHQKLYPLPITELQRNPNLIQNLGY